MADIKTEFISGLKKHPGGRPLKFSSKSKLIEAIANYFQSCQDHTEDIITREGVQKDVNIPYRPTIAGLAYALGCDRQTIYNYSNKNEFFDIIARAREHILNTWEEKAVNVNGNIRGLEFIMQNYGYSSNSKIEHNVPAMLGKFIEDSRIPGKQNEPEKQPE